MKKHFICLLIFTLFACSSYDKQLCSLVFIPNYNVSVNEVLKLGRTRGMDVNIYQLNCGDTLISYYLNKNNTAVEVQSWEFKISTIDTIFDSFFSTNAIYIANANGNVGVSISELKKYSKDHLTVQSEKTKCYYTLSKDESIYADSADILIYYNFPLLSEN